MFLADPGHLMTGRFFIAADEPHSSQSRDRVVGMDPVFCSGSFRVWSEGPAIHTGKRGVIIGHMFTRTLPSRRVSQIDQPAYDRLERSGFLDLTRDYWGAYIAIFLTGSGHLAIFRDPSGALPCFFGSADGRVRLSSDADLAAANDGASRVDYLELARFLWSPDAMGPATCVAGVNELIAGHCLTTDGQRCDIACWWSPWDFVDSRAASRPTDAPQKLHATTVDCVRTWAECFPNIVLGVSGGLDSSIVAASLPPEAPSIRCLTMIGPDPEGDESGYATTLTDALGLPLIMERYNLLRIDVGRGTLPHLPWPIARQFAQNIQAVHTRLADENTVDAYFTGNGGDNVFCSMRSTTPIVDRFLTEGLGPGLCRSVIDVCDLTEASLLAVVKAGWQKYRRGGRGYAVVPESRGLSIQATEAIAGSLVRHPWLEAPAGSLPGKAAHVAMLMRAQKGLELYPRGKSAPQIAPLLSQPLVELCLTIPAWQWIGSGQDRACARQAFADVLPAALINRTSKGGPGGFMRQIFEHHADTVLAMLRDGILVREKIVDPGFLDEPAIPGWRGIAKTQRLMALCAAESWARSWENQHSTTR
ncbi:asparagine synthetase B family protein [Novosphingobium sp. AP12]|uniref:asparagine synthase-related protein n=1 Tax=Novosphingobium sp. AP12 TaxID=1144305 RepID=UPI0012F89B00|nr:asparagine synthetase B family protein [Novosphingobium sp. AP12]